MENKNTFYTGTIIDWDYHILLPSKKSVIKIILDEPKTLLTLRVNPDVDFHCLLKIGNGIYLEKVEIKPNFISKLFGTKTKYRYMIREIREICEGWVKVEDK